MPGGGGLRLLISKFGEDADSLVRPGESNTRPSGSEPKGLPQLLEYTVNIFARNLNLG
jgi:hypothetical protein